MRYLNALVAALLLMTSASSRADLIYAIDLDTRSLTGSGFIELSLAGLDDAPVATALITSTDPAYADVIDQYGMASGDLRSSLNLANTLGLSGLLQQIHFGDVLQLQVVFGGEWLQAIADAGSTFAIKLWSDGFESLLTDDLAGDLLRLELQPGGMVGIESLSAFVTVQPVFSVPTPAAAMLLLLGLSFTASFGMLSRRVNSRRQNQH